MATIVFWQGGQQGKGHAPFVKVAFSHNDWNSEGIQARVCFRCVSLVDARCCAEGHAEGATFFDKKSPNTYLIAVIMANVHGKVARALRKGRQYTLKIHRG